MSTSLQKKRKPWRGATGALSILIAAASLPASAESWLDLFNPLNLFKGEKYETKIVPMSRRTISTIKRSPGCNPRITTAPPKNSPNSKSNIPTRNGKEKGF